MDKKFAEPDDLMMGMLVLMVDYPCQDFSPFVESYDEDKKPIFNNDKLMEFAREKGRQFKEYVKKMDYEKGSN